MITITSSTESTNDLKYMSNTIIRVDEDAHIYDAIDAYIKVLKLEGYTEKSINEALIAHAEDICSNA